MDMESDRERNYKRKRWMSFVIVLGYLFLGGCEYVVILPTVWNYLQSVGITEEHWLGFTISTYSTAAAISGLIGGRLADKYYKHTKVLVIGFISCRVIGNFQYMLGGSVWNIICGRMLCGLGSVSGTALLAEVCRTTSMKERSTFLSSCNATFQIGIMIGPGLQFILSYFNFTLFGFSVNILNAPGLFIGVLWLFYTLAAVVMYSNLTDEFRVIEEMKREGAKGPEKVNGLETITESGPENLSRNEEIQQSKQEIGAYRKYLNDFLTDSYVVLMSLVFALYFSQMAFETVIPVITEDNFGFGIRENTFIYMTGGIEALMTYVGIAFIGKYVRETTLQFIGWFLILSAQVWLIIVMPHFEKGNHTHMVYFLMGIFLIYLGSPIASVGNTALSSKVLSNETQGLGQGVRRVIVHLGLIFGPTWAGSTVTKPYLFLGVGIALMLVNGVMLMASFKRLRQAEAKMTDTIEQPKPQTDDESRPLLQTKP